MEWLLIMNGSFPGLRSQKSSMYSKLESREYTWISPSHDFLFSSQPSQGNTQKRMKQCGHLKSLFKCTVVRKQFSKRFSGEGQIFLTHWPISGNLARIRDILGPVNQILYPFPFVRAKTLSSIWYRSTRGTGFYKKGKWYPFNAVLRDK